MIQMGHTHAGQQQPDWASASVTVTPSSQLRSWGEGDVSMTLMMFGVLPSLYVVACVNISSDIVFIKDIFRLPVSTESYEPPNKLHI